MNSAQTKNKKISEYKIEDISLLFSDLLKKISSKIILLEIGTDFLKSFLRTERQQFSQ